ncbi:cordon-bleu protein-like 1 isoform X1 [Sinocyclocheilus anshuiensis]|uniref:Cordon-bleu protein-like 1 n=2 Tax=Sinocyclocheilus anshuiensis TaxID=1608454 RepID=A0A671Q5M1_9TELE|nr:PREDICTED: cordon-bleu protein-like 1 isoform X1 [Sinocyclocheilus anshuiensis]
MTADSRAKVQGRSSARDFRAVQVAAGMDGDAHSRPPDRRRSSKSKAPPPPPVLKGLDAPLLSHKLPAYPYPAMEQKENLLDQDLTLTVVLPEGLEKTMVVHGSKPMMDLLVMLCAKYHLNPSGHTIELVTTNRNQVTFKPNALIGALEAEKILLKPKGMEDKSKKTGPQMPEATVRLVINYKKTQKTILRVSPRVPLQELLPAICEKCEFDLQTTVLLRNVHSEDTLDLCGSLNDFGLREVYARDTKVISPVSPISPVSLPPSPSRSEIFHHGKEKIQREKEKTRFSLFRKGSKKQSEQSMTVSAPASPVHRKQRPVSMSSFSTHSPITYDCNTMPSDMPKKRRAPLPPSMMSQSMPTDLGHHHSNTQTTVHHDGNQNMAPLSRGSSTESSFKKSTKRKAPPPPTSSSAAPPDETTQDKDMTEPVLASPLEEIREQEEMTVSAEGQVAAVEEEEEDDSSLNLSADISLDSGRAGTATPSQDSEILESRMARDNPSCDLSPDADVAEATVNGEIKSDQAASSQIPSEEIEPPVEKTEEAIKPSEGCPVLEEVSVSTAEKPASLCNKLQTSECGIQTLHTDLQTQGFDSNTEPSREDQTPKIVPSTVRFAHTETQMQTEPQKPSETSSSCTESSTAPSASSTELKRDMATSTEELRVPEPHSSAIQATQDMTSTPTSKTNTVQYIVDAEPKPKPSNELTREYIPKVGMTTYTIVPQKSLEKLRFFEVELTLEPNVDYKPETKTVSNGTVAVNGHQNVFEQTSLCTSPPATVSSPVEGTESNIKNKKVPPATRPKPASFRLPQHKRTPGDYVASAAVRRASFGSNSSSSSCCSSPAAQPKETASSPQSDVFTALENFPPPPPPVQWEDEENARASDAPQTAEVDVSLPKAPKFPPSSVLSSQKSLPTNPTPSLSLEKLRSFAAPKPYLPSMSSRFAQAVSSAVKQSLSHPPLRQLPCTHLPTKQRSITESQEPSASTVTDNGEGRTERSGEAPSQTAGHGDPAPSSARDGGMGTCKIGNTQPSPGSEASVAPSATLKGISEGFHSVEE